MSGTFNVRTTGKRKSSTVYGNCVLCSDLFTARKTGNTITANRWLQIKERAAKWKDLDRFGDLSNKINWDAGSGGK